VICTALRSGDAKNLGLFAHRKFVVCINHRFELSKPTLMSALSKKSFSDVSSPILACKTFTTTVDSAGLVAPNAVEAACSNSAFHWAI
jgi:hypothetical protein|tara:strand:+ start:213 stop:476 length:264 start_codon:yes stop_codon:yes gene_type:complete